MDRGIEYTWHCRVTFHIQGESSSLETMVKGSTWLEAAGRFNIELSGMGIHDTVMTTITKGEVVYDEHPF